MIFSIDTKIRSHSGIYVIRNTIDDRKYIGSTKNFYQRYKDHLSELKRKTHVNPIMQNFVNKYGVDSLSFEVLCLCPEEHRLFNEQVLIDFIRPEWNIRPVSDKRIKSPHNIAQKKLVIDTINSILK